MSPVIEHVRIGGAWVGSGGEPPDPAEAFILGVTEPTPENTGPRIAATTTYGSPGNPYVLTISSPGTYSGLEVWGRIHVTIQSGVHIVDSRVHMTGSPTQNQHGILFDHADAQGHTVQFCSIDIPDEDERQNPNFSSGIRGRGYVVSRCDIRHTVDGAMTTGNSGQTITRSAEFYGNYMAEFVERSDAGQSDGKSHDDCIQVLGGLNVTIIGNALHGGTTSCIILNKEVTPAYGDVTVEDNWMYGHPSAGATINVTSTGSTQIPGAVRIHRNRVDPSGNLTGQIRATSPNRVPQWFGYTSGTANGASTADWVAGSDVNIYMGTGDPVPVRVG